MHYLQLEPNRKECPKNKPLEAPLMSPKKTIKLSDSDSYALFSTTKVKRNEFTKNIKNCNFSPIRHIGNSNNRMSFQSQSPTRYDEMGSTSKSSNLKTNESPFAESPNGLAHSEDYDQKDDS